MTICLNYFYIINGNDGILENCFLGESLKTVSEKLNIMKLKTKFKKLSQDPEMFLRQEVKILWEALPKKKKSIGFEKQTKNKWSLSWQKKGILTPETTWILMKSSQEVGLEEEEKKSSF